MAANSFKQLGQRQVSYFLSMVSRTSSGTYTEKHQHFPDLLHVNVAPQRGHVSGSINIFGAIGIFISI
jgi:hypothetical protein